MAIWKPNALTDIDRIKRESITRPENCLYFVIDKLQSQPSYFTTARRHSDFFLLQIKLVTIGKSLWPMECLLTTVSRSGWPRQLSFSLSATSSGKKAEESNCGNSDMGANLPHDGDGSGGALWLPLKKVQVISRCWTNILAQPLPPYSIEHSQVSPSWSNPQLMMSPHREWLIR